MTYICSSSKAFYKLFLNQPIHEQNGPICFNMSFIFRSMEHMYNNNNNNGYGTINCRFGGHGSWLGRRERDTSTFCQMKCKCEDHKQIKGCLNYIIQLLFLIFLISQRSIITRGHFHYKQSPWFNCYISIMMIYCYKIGCFLHGKGTEVILTPPKTNMNLFGSQEEKQEGCILYREREGFKEGVN